MVFGYLWKTSTLFASSGRGIERRDTGASDVTERDWPRKPTPSANPRVNPQNGSRRPPRPISPRRNQRRGLTSVYWRVNELTKLDPRFSDVTESHPNFPVKTPSEQPLKRYGGVSRKLLPIGISVKHPRQHVRHRLTLKHAITCKHLEEHNTERPDVTPLVLRASLRLVQATYTRRSP